jgi:hypothetical protein
VRSKVEHIFYRVKRIFGYGKVVYRGILKNSGRFVYGVYEYESVEMDMNDEACKRGGDSLIGGVRPFSPFPGKRTDR